MVLQQRSDDLVMRLKLNIFIQHQNDLIIVLRPATGNYIYD